MDQDTVAWKVLKELIDFGFCDQKDEEVVWEYLNQVYGAGYDHGWGLHTKRQHNRSISIIQMTLDGNFLKMWDSAAEAGRGTGIDRSSITTCLKKRSKTSGGFKWKYAPPPISSSEPTIGSVKSESIQQEQENRVSKIASERSPQEFL